MEDIEEEVNHQNSSLIYYVVGANPPIQVMEGFVRRVWRKFNVDKVVLISTGVYLALFDLMLWILGIQYDKDTNSLITNLLSWKHGILI